MFIVTLGAYATVVLQLGLQKKLDNLDHLKYIFKIVISTKRTELDHELKGQWGDCTSSYGSITHWLQFSNHFIAAYENAAFL